MLYIKYTTQLEIISVRIVLFVAGTKETQYFSHANILVVVRNAQRILLSQI
jgi:hypothetical protein